MNMVLTVIGSSNTDRVVKANRLPAPGETIIGGVFAYIPAVKERTRQLQQAGGMVPVFIDVLLKTSQDLQSPELCNHAKEAAKAAIPINDVLIMNCKEIQL